MTTFRALWVEKNDAESSKAKTSQTIVERNIDDLPAGDILINVKYSSINYKDAMSAKGIPGVTRSYPHTPGIDAAGIVSASNHSDFAVGDEVICIGYDLGMNTVGGLAEYIRVPANWVSKLPEGLSLKDSMVIGTAGFTAALCVEKLLMMGAKVEDGAVIVTGATGGVGSVAVLLLSKLGFDVVSSSGKAEQTEFLLGLGAKEVITRSELSELNKRPMLAPKWAHCVDCVGGEILNNVLKQTKPGGSVAVCGLVASPALATTVLPFILRGINLLGVDSVEIPLVHKNKIWQLLATDWQLSTLASITHEVDLDSVPAVIDKMIAGKAVGRTLVNMT